MGDVTDVKSGLPLSPGEAVKLVSAFLPSWSNVSEANVSVRKLQHGYVSAVHVVTRAARSADSDGANNDDQDADAVILRQMGGFFADQQEIGMMSEAEQALLFHELSNRGWGPRLYGVSNGCRVEQFIPSHTLTPEDMKDPLTRDACARAFARLHSLSLPFDRRRMDDLLDFMSSEFTRMKQDLKAAEIKQLLSTYGNESAVYLSDHMMDIDFTSELQWLQRLLKEHDCPRTLIHLDNNFLNILVREDACDSSHRVTLIDYDLCMNGYRAVDFGTLFANHLCDWKGKESKLSGGHYPSLLQQESFFHAYSDQMVSLGQALTDRDTIDHLLLEANIGSLLYASYMVILFLRLAHGFAHEPVFATGIKALMQLYHQQKDQLLLRLTTT